MQTHRLVCHPDTPPERVAEVRVDLEIDEWHCMRVVYHVQGGASVVVPARQSSDRTDGLWTTTCFEMFWKPESGKRYFEFNFSSSTRWAAYEFVAYREGMRDLQIYHPDIETTLGRDLSVAVGLELMGFSDGPAMLGLSAVIEEIDGTKSYWALCHPTGAPDFHHHDCFALELAAPDLT